MNLKLTLGTRPSWPHLVADWKSALPASIRVSATKYTLFMGFNSGEKLAPEIANALHELAAQVDRNSSF